MNHTIIDLNEGENPEVTADQYPTGHGTVWCLRIGSTDPGTIRFGDKAGIVKMRDACEELIKKAEAEELKNLERNLRNQP